MSQFFRNKGGASRARTLVLCYESEWSIECRHWANSKCEIEWMSFQWRRNRSVPCYGPVFLMRHRDPVIDASSCHLSDVSVRCLTGSLALPFINTGEITPAAPMRLTGVIDVSDFLSSITSALSHARRCWWCKSVFRIPETFSFIRRDHTDRVSKYRYKDHLATFRLSSHGVSINENRT